MNADKSDEVLNKLYQQRKSTVVAPDIHLPVRNSDRKAKGTWARLTVALLGGGLASFGILAVISQLAKSPVPEHSPQPPITRNNPVEYQPDDLNELQAQAVEQALEKITKSLPEVPKTPERTANTLDLAITDFPTISTEILNEHLILTIKQPAINLTLNYKVLPEFPNSALENQRSGFVKLSYQVTEQGTVENIKLLDGSHYRVFQQSAINALAQWRYTAKEASNKDKATAEHLVKAKENNTEYEIVFEFITAN
ncbi:TonB family protein [Thalassotalea agariperforans]